jgi:hypothetical protein
MLATFGFTPFRLAKAFLKGELALDEAASESGVGSRTLLDGVP